MATIKKPAKKMQTGGKVKIKIKIKPDRNSNKNENPLRNEELSRISNEVRNKILKNQQSMKASKDSYSLDKASKDAGFETNPARKATFNVPEVKQQKKGGVTKKAKSGGSFPDLNKDGKITKADILKGRGVIAKKGAKLKKQAAVAIAMKKAGKTPKAQSGASFKNITDMFGRTGGFDGGMRNQMAASILKKKKAAAAPTMKKGGAMKKCKYGCK